MRAADCGWPSPSSTSASLADEAVHAIQTSATVAGVRLTIDAGEQVPVFGDPTRLHQLLGNLLSNAIKFSPRGGRVHVIVDTIGLLARVRVMDEGPGIPEGERDQLFERFYRLASSTEMGVPGTGLGLAIAKSVAEAHEGFVDIVDTPGWSTTFSVFLPLRTAGASPNPLHALRVPLPPPLPRRRPPPPPRQLRPRRRRAPRPDRPPHAARKPPDWCAHRRP